MKEEVKRALRDLLAAMPLDAGHVLVVGTSTSEVAGKRIGSGGSEEIARELYEGISEIQKQAGFHWHFNAVNI